MDALRLEGLDLRVLVQRLREHVIGDGGSIEYVEGFHDNDVHHAVLHRSPRCDVGVVAILGGVGTGNEERLMTVGAALILDDIGLRFVFQSFLQHVLHVGDRPALAGLGKLQ